LRSGQAVVNALQEQNYNVKAIDGVEELLTLDIKTFDAVFNILHGDAGENGELAGVLSCLGINYTGCDVAGAVLSWNKDIAKTLITNKGIKTPQSQTVTHISELKVKGDGPWIVKPTKEGSSVGLYFTETISQLKLNVFDALQSVDSVLVEDFIKGTECTVAIVNNVVLPVIKIEPKTGLYDYQAKYESTETQYFCPSGFSENLEQALKSDALLAFNTLELKGWARIDFIVDENDNRWFLEANTTPGLTKTSLVPIAGATHGWDFNDLVKQILDTAFDGENHE
jgi:D-alanine-D-alanine ligase